MMSIYTKEVKRRMLTQEIAELEIRIEQYNEVLKTCSAMTRRTHTQDLYETKQSLKSKQMMLETLKGD